MAIKVTLKLYAEEYWKVFWEALLEDSNVASIMQAAYFIKQVVDYFITDSICNRYKILNKKEYKNIMKREKFKSLIIKAQLHKLGHVILVVIKVSMHY